MAATTFFAQASANRRNSFLLAVFVVAILGLLGFTVGYAIVGDPAGGVAATGAALLLGGLIAVGTYFQGDKLVLAVSGSCMTCSALVGIDVPAPAPPPDLAVTVDDDRRIGHDHRRQVEQARQVHE